MRKDFDQCNGTTGRKKLAAKVAVQSGGCSVLTPKSINISAVSSRSQASTKPMSAGSRIQASVREETLLFKPSSQARKSTLSGAKTGKTG